MWKELIKADFGIDLPISGGNGNSVAAPILIHADSAYVASHVQFELARCVYGRLGFHWRTIEKRLLPEPHSRIEKVTFALKYADNEKIVTERRSFYFDLANVRLEAGAGTPPCGFGLGEPFQFGLPSQFGWLHRYGPLVKYEHEHPGLGISMAYGAPFTEATIYVYNRQLRAIDGHTSHEIVASEFDGAVGELIAVNPQAQLLEEDRRQNLFFKSFEVDNTYTTIMLSTVNNHFFKVRSTIKGSEDRYVFDCMMESLSEINSVIEPVRQLKSRAH